MAQSLHFLETGDFSIVPGQEGRANMLCHSLRGLSLVLFYTKDCEYCPAAIPVFKALPMAIGNCKFAMVNLSTNRELIRISRETNTEINMVPLIICYVNGKPYMRYDGPREVQDLQEFVSEIAAKIKQAEASAHQAQAQAQAQQQPQQPQEEKKGKIPVHAGRSGRQTTRKAVGACYLSYDAAYGNDGEPYPDVPSHGH